MSSWKVFLRKTLQRSSWMVFISVPIQWAHTVRGLLSTWINSSILISSLSDPSIFSAMVVIASSMDALFSLPFFVVACVPFVLELVPVDWWADWLVGWSVD